ncbi:MAG: hypothetical protein ACW972_03310 [Promethearchaeota archaeon]|jgi:hypothetical protein
MKFLFSKDVLNTFEEEVSPGIYDQLYFRITGTNQAGQTVAHSDFTFSLIVNGEQKINVPGSWVYEYCKNKYGDVEDTSAAGAAFALSGIFDFSWFGIPNSLHVAPSDHVTFGIQHTGLSVKVASGTFILNGVAGRSPFNYMPKLLTNNRTVSGATVHRDKVPMENITEAWLNAAGSLVTNVLVEKDGDLFINADYDEILAYTSMSGRFEGAVATWAKVELAKGFSQLLSDDVIIQATYTGADTLNVVVLSFEYNDVRRTQSIGFVAQLAKNTLVMAQSRAPARASQVSVVKKISSGIPLFQAMDSPSQEQPS